MGLGLLLKYPKLLGAGIAVVVILSIGVHYRLVIGERNDLRTEKIALEFDLAKAATNIEKYKENARIAAEATALVTAERDAHRASLDLLRAGREDDPEALEWAAQPLPAGELIRLCEALPEMTGCVTPNNN